MFGSSARNKKTDAPTPDEHIPLVRLDDGGWLGGASDGGDRLSRLESVEKTKDAMLDDMESAVDRLGFIASTIRNEVGEHEELLDGLGDELESADERMSSTMQKVEKLLGTSDSGRLSCIFGLVVVNVILIFIITFF
mmetsp:Transcript_27502/g.66897  ORF Transcript_27502/g.66897 Transcript_27502/m.66897 type:complete len:137 (-) Transcript_27502:317-727(-)